MRKSMPAFYGERLNVCLRAGISAQIFVRPRKTTTLAVHNHYLGARFSATLRCDIGCEIAREGNRRNDRARSGLSRTTFPPRDVELEPRRASHRRDAVGLILFRLKRSR